MTVDLELLKPLADTLCIKFKENMALKRRRQLNSAINEEGGFQIPSKKSGRIHVNVSKKGKKMPKKKGRPTLSAERTAQLEKEYTEAIERSRVRLGFDGTSKYYCVELAFGDGFRDIGKGKAWEAESSKGEINFTQRDAQYESSLDTLIQKSIAKWAFEEGLSVKMSSDGGELWDII